MEINMSFVEKLLHKKPEPQIPDELLDKTKQALDIEVDRLLKVNFSRMIDDASKDESRMSESNTIAGMVREYANKCFNRAKSGKAIDSSSFAMKWHNETMEDKFKLYQDIPERAKENVKTLNEHMQKALEPILEVFLGENSKTNGQSNTYVRH